MIFQLRDGQIARIDEYFDAAAVGPLAALLTAACGADDAAGPRRDGSGRTDADSGGGPCSRRSSRPP
jgi:hypothetical protein